MAPDYFKNKVIWITGASSGLGEALALNLSHFDVSLILSGRRVTELELVAEKCKLNGSDANVLPFDLLAEKEVADAADLAISIYGRIDILIINGGVTQRSFVLDTPVSVDRKIMEIDFFSGVVLTKKVLPLMIQNGYGHIVTISSITGLFGFPQRSAYSAAKHAMLGFYETLWAETHTKGINITTVCPGRIQTNISLNAITAEGNSYGVMDHGPDTGIKAEVCAKKILKAVYKRKNQIIIANRNERILIWFKKNFSWLFYQLVDKVKPV